MSKSDAEELCGNTFFRITEVEVYFNDDKNHKDTFTHGDKYQRNGGHWYFHRMNGGTYKAGTYKGLDLAIGKGD